MGSLDDKIKKKKRRKKTSRHKEEDFDYTKMNIKEYLKIGVLKDDSSFSRKAGQRFDLAYMIIPKLSSFIKFCFCVIILCMLIIIYSVYTKPSPMLLFSYQNGDVKCPIKNIDIRTGQIVPRTKHETQVCNMLEINDNQSYVSSSEAVSPVSNNKEGSK